MSATISTKLVIRKLQPRHIEAVLATEYPVDGGGESEVLVISPEAVNLERFPLPLLVSHDMSRLPVGVAANPRFEDRKLIADLLLADNEGADELYERIKDGVLNNLSIGYRVNKAEKTASGKRVTRFTPHEVSLVSVPADPQAKITQVRVMENASPYADQEDLEMIE